MKFNIAKIRDWFIVIGILVFLIMIAIPIIAITSMLFDLQKSSVSAAPSFDDFNLQSSIMCSATYSETSEINGYTAEIGFSNSGDKDVKAISCEVIDANGLNIKSSTEKIDLLQSGSRDACLFELKGTPTGSKLKFKISYDGKSHTDYCTI